MRVQCEIANAPKANGVHDEKQIKNHKIKYILALAKYAGSGLIAAAEGTRIALNLKRFRAFRPFLVTIC